jgi:hypothetical protein
MIVERYCALHDKINQMELPVTPEQLERYQTRDPVTDRFPSVQEVFPNLTPAQREFLVTGLLEDESDELFGKLEELDDDEETGDRPECDNPQPQCGEPGEKICEFCGRLFCMQHLNGRPDLGERTVLCDACNRTAPPLDEDGSVLAAEDLPAEDADQEHEQDVTGPGIPPGIPTERAQSPQDEQDEECDA